MLKGDQNIASLRAAEKRRKVIQMRLEGHDWETIAAEVGYAGRSAAFTAVEDALKQAQKLLYRDVELYRLESMERLRELIKALWDRRDDEKVAAEIRRCTERLDKLTGAERPIRVEIGESDVDRALRELDAELNRRSAAAAGEAATAAGSAAGED